MGHLKLFYFSNILQQRLKKLNAATSEPDIITSSNPWVVASKNRFTMFGAQVKPKKSLARTKSEMIRPEPVLAGQGGAQRQIFYRTKSDLGRNVAMPSPTAMPNRPSIKPASHSTEKQTFKEVFQIFPVERENNGLTGQAAVKPVRFPGPSCEEPRPQEGFLTAQSSLESAPSTPWKTMPPPPPPVKPKKSPGVPQVRCVG